MQPIRTASSITFQLRTPPSPFPATLGEISHILLQAVLQTDRPKGGDIAQENGTSSPPLYPPRAPLSKGGRNMEAKEEEQIQREVRGEGKSEAQNAQDLYGKEGKSSGSMEEECPETGGNAERGDGKEEEKEETEEEREKRREQRADVDRHMAKLYITVLQAKHQERSRGGGGEFSRVPTSEGGEEEEESGFLSGFASLGIGELPMCNPSAVPGDFESVRDVFKKAKVRRQGMAIFLFAVFLGGAGVARQGSERAASSCRCVGGGSICVLTGYGRALMVLLPVARAWPFATHPIPFLMELKLSGRTE